MKFLRYLPFLTVAMAGCATDTRLSFLDGEISEMIRERQAEALRQPNLDDPHPVVASAAAADANDNAWEKNPVTRNPGTHELEARTDPKGNQPLARAPIPPAAKLLDLNGLLAQAIYTAPEYRTAKETLMISALTLVISRHTWGPRFFADVAANLNGTPEAGDHDTASNLIADLGVTQNLPFGGSVSATALTTFASFLRQQAANEAPLDTQTAQLQLALTVPLMRGSGRVAQASLVQDERNLVYAARGLRDRPAQPDGEPGRRLFRDPAKPKSH